MNENEKWTCEYRDGIGWVILSDGIDGFDPISGDNVVAFVNETDLPERDFSRAEMICAAHNGGAA